MITKLRLHNFMKHKDLSLNLNKLSIIVGPNGVGKSTILDGISFALYGKISRKIKKSEIKSIGVKSNLFAELTYNDHVIKRFTNKVFIDGKEYATKEAEEHIYNIINFNYDYFKNLFYISQGHLLDFIYINGADKKRLLDRIFFGDIQFEKLYNYMQSIESKYKKDFSVLTDISDKLEELQKTFKNNTTKILSLKQNYEKLASVIKLKEKELKNIQSRLSTQSLYQKILPEKKYLLQRLNEITLLSDEELEILNKQLNDLKQIQQQLSNLPNYKQILSLCEYLYDNWNVYSSFNKDEYIKKKSLQKLDDTLLSKIKASRLSLLNINNKDIFLNKIKQHELLVLSIGYNEDTIFDEEYIKKYKFIYDNLQLIDDIFRKYNINDKPDLGNVILTIKNKIKMLEMHNNISDEINAISLKIQNNNKLIQERNKITKRLEEINKLLTKQVISNDNLDDLINKNNLLTSEFDDLHKRWIQVSTELSKLEKELLIIENDIKTKTQLLKSLKQDKIRFEIYNKLKTLFSKDGIPLIMRKRVYKPLEDRLNYYLMEFGFDNLKFTINDQLDLVPIGLSSIDQLSGGQKVAVSLSLRFAIADILGVKIPFLLIDEPTIHLDTDRIEDLLEIITKISHNIQVIVVTHSEQFLRLGNVIVIN